MDIILLGITIISLIVALVMSIAAWRVTRDEKHRSAARVAALSVAASAHDDFRVNTPVEMRSDKPIAKAPWSAPKTMAPPLAPADELPLNQFRTPVVVAEPTNGRDTYEAHAVSHASGFLGATEVAPESGGRQRTLAFAAVVLLLGFLGSLVWSMSAPRGTSAVAVGPNSPLELVSLSHQRQNEKLAVSGLVRNPVAGAPVERLSAVVFLFDRVGTFVASSRANVDFLKLGAGDESPFVVSIEAPATVARYRVSFRTDDGVVPHIDRRGATPAPAEGEEPVNVTLKQE
jgi:hypothetical protein